MNKKIIEYKLVYVVGSGSLDLLQHAVNEHISQGWQPLGSMCELTQAMVKYEGSEQLEHINRSDNAQLPTPNQKGDEA